MLDERRIGVFGGTFDPPHFGHLIMAEEAREQMSLSRVIFVPTGYPWLKSDRSVSPVEHRLAMIRLAIAPNPLFELSTTEAEREGPSYTADTLEILRKQGGLQGRVHLILGVDSLFSLPGWKNPARIVEECEFVILPRLGRGRHEINDLEAKLPGISDRITWLKVPEIGISSTDIRERVSKGLSIRYLVPEGIETYIKERGLYRPK